MRSERQSGGAVFLVAVAGAALLIAVAPASGAGASARAPVPGVIVLVVIDALRADHLGCYGYERATSPHIDKLSREASLFTQAITPGGWTGVAVPSILTGTYPSRHRADDWNKPRQPGIATLPQLLQPRGFRSGFFANHAALGMVDVREGFDEVVIRTPDRMPSSRMTAQALRWIERNRQSPVFVYLHYHGSHSPYRPPEPYRSMYLNDAWRFRKVLPIDEDSSYDADPGTIPYTVVENGITDAGYYTAQYDGAISYADAQIGRLVKGLQGLHLYEDALFVLTADHGELLGEHDIYFDHVGCYEGNIRVPLLVKYPSHHGRGQRISQQTSLIDIAPTILELVGEEVPPSVQGKSLRVWSGDGTEPPRPFVYAQKLPHRCVRSPDWKLLFDGRSYALYDLQRDPEEKRNLVEARTEKYEELKTVLELHERERTAPNGAMAETQGRRLSEGEKVILRSLGYSR